MSARAALITGATVVVLLAGVGGAIRLLRSGAAAEAPGRGERPAEISETVNPSPGDAADYWTPERMRSARPAPMPEGRNP